MVIYQTLVEVTQTLNKGRYPIIDGYLGKIGSVIKVDVVSRSTVSVFTILEDNKDNYSLVFAKDKFLLTCPHCVKEYRLKKVRNKGR